MHIARLGQGPDLVLIHGWAMHGGIFAPLTERLRHRFTLHVVDLPGHGFSREVPVQPHLERLAGAIVDDVPRAVWIGWSLGGLVALTAALRNPAQVRGIVALASSPRFLVDAGWPGVELAMFESFDAELRDDYRQVIERFLALEALGSPEPQSELRDLRTRVFERGTPSIDALTTGMHWLEAADLRQDLPQLTMPSLWIAGRRDRLIPPAAMQQAAALASHARFLEVPAGHAPFIGYAPAVSDAMTDFIGALP